ncbi:hypothetical protein pb186bvf_009718 [Paramecium bursaria]
MDNIDKQRVIKEGVPKVATRYPFTVHMEEGIEYFYCTCGLSDGQPWCDQKCDGTQFKPIKICPLRTGKQLFVNFNRALLCGCKRNTGNKPQCDGSHSVINLDW